MNIGYIIARAVKRYKNRPAVICHDKTFSFEEINHRVNSLTNALLALNFQKGDRIALLQNNCHRSIESTFALFKGGFVRVPLNTRYSMKEHLFMLKDTEAKGIILGPEFSGLIDLFKEELHGLEHFIIIGKTLNGTFSYEDLIETHSSDEPQMDLNEGELATILYTSGTTGKQKGVMLTHRHWRIFTTNILLERFSVSSTDLILHVAPLTHASGAYVLPHFVKGAANVVLPKFDAKLFLDTVQKYGITTVLLVPTMISVLLDYPNLSDYDLSSLHTLTYGAAPMPVERLREARKIFGNILVQAYSLSEAPYMVTVLTKEDHIGESPKDIKRLSSCGREFFNAEVRIVDGKDKVVPPGEVGQIIVRGDFVMEGYWKLPEKTRETIRDGWVYTGDVGRMDEEGYIYLLDRKNDMIISGGFNIYPREVEDVICQNPHVVEAAVIGVPDKKWGEAVKSVVVLKENASLTEEELIAFCRQHLSSFKKPKSVDFVESLPKNSYGKVLKKDLKDVYWKGYDRRVH